MFLQLLPGAEPLSALQTSNLIPLRFLVAPAAGVLLVPLEVVLIEKLSQTRHTVNALRFTLVLTIQLCQAEVAAAPYAGVGQQTKMGEAVSQEGVLLVEDLWAVSAFKIAITPVLLVASKGLWSGETAATCLTVNIQHAFL